MIELLIFNNRIGVVDLLRDGGKRIKKYQERSIMCLIVGLVS